MYVYQQVVKDNGSEENTFFESQDWMKILRTAERYGWNFAGDVMPLECKNAGNDKRTCGQFPASCAAGDCKGQYITKEGVQNLCKALDRALQEPENSPTKKQEKALQELYGRTYNALRKFHDDAMRHGPLDEMIDVDIQVLAMALNALGSDFCSKRTIKEFLEFTQGEEGLKVYNVPVPTSDDEDDDEDDDKLGDNEDHEVYDDQKYYGDEPLPVVH